MKAVVVVVACCCGGRKGYWWCEQSAEVLNTLIKQRVTYVIVTKKKILPFCFSI